MASEDRGTEAPELRVGDRERRATDERLRAALDDGVLTLTEYDERTKACWGARVQRELDTLVADLPEPAGATTVSTPQPPPPAPVAAPPPPVRERERSRDSLPERIGKSVVGLAFLGVVAYGAISIFGATDGAAVFGSRTVVVPPTAAEVQVGNLFGSPEIVVPDGVTVRNTGVVVFGSVDCEQACRISPGGATQREVVVDTRGAFGSPKIMTQSEAAAGGLRDRGDRDDDN